MSNPLHSAMSERQAKQLFADLRKAFTPLSGIGAPLQVGSVDSETLKRLNFYTTEPQPIYLLPQGIWHASVRGLGDLGKLADEEMLQFVDPFTAANNLLVAAQQMFKGCQSFVEELAAQPNAAHILGRCLREPITRTLWMSQSGRRFPSEEEINELLDKFAGGKV
jgi:hypothetical protein